MTAVLKTGQYYGNILQKSAWSGICLSEKATLIFPCGGGLIARTTIARLALVPSDPSTSPGAKIVFSKGAAAPKATLWRRNSRLCILTSLGILFTSSVGSRMDSLPNFVLHVVIAWNE